MKRVLVVEDSADIRRLVRMALEPEGFAIFETNNAERGLDAVRSLKPDLLLLDVMMPGKVDGLEMCRRVRGDPETAGIRVVMLTALGSGRDRERGDEAGADAYIVKPFSPLQLLQTIAVALGTPRTTGG